MQSNRIKILKSEVLSDDWYTLLKITYEYLKKEGTLETHSREVYDRGNGAAILLYNIDLRKVVLIKQFRLPSYVNGNPTGMLIETCAGLLDKENAEECIRRETEEETGYRISRLKKIFEAYMSPGSVTEIIYFFIGEYSNAMKVNKGGGIEQEDIDVLELDFDVALKMIDTGAIRDGKTIMLLQHLRLKNIL
jgi:GDP-mannose pyrophosphatase NudK